MFKLSMASGATLASIDVGAINCAMFVVDSDGACILFQVKEIGKDPRDVVECLDRWISVWKRCHGFLIETQLPINTTACKIQSSIMTYFQTLFGNFKLVLAVSSRLKTSGFVGSTKRERKLHCIEKGTNLVSFFWPERIACLNAMAKKDDICDAVCQWFAFCKTNRALFENNK
jgi:hypothetical protein